MRKASWDLGVNDIPQPKMWRARTYAFGFLVCSLENLYFLYDEIISTSKLPFYNPLVKNITTFLAYFSLDYENCPST